MKKLLPFLFLFFCSFSYGQQVNTLVLREIIQEPFKEVKPSVIRVDAKGGIIETSTRYNDGCREKIHFEWNFDKDMSVLKAGEVYGFNYYAKIIDGNCNTNPWREPYLRANSSDGGFSGAVQKTNYKMTKSLHGGAITNYARARPGSKDVTGVQRGKFTVTGYTKGRFSYFYFYISSASNTKGESFLYEVVYIYELTDDVPSSPVSTGCVAPDCSDFPGTIPVWNFQTNRGECWCPEGMVWDRMENRCTN